MLAGKMVCSNFSGCNSAAPRVSARRLALTGIYRLRACRRGRLQAIHEKTAENMRTIDLSRANVHEQQVVLASGEACGVQRHSQRAQRSLVPGDPSPTQAMRARMVSHEDA